MASPVQNRKIVGIAELLALREQARIAGKTVVHCHGCFDIVHPGHIHHLQYARGLGDLLIVSVSADSRINKGVDRPLIPDDLRAGSLAALECVDFVYVDNHPTAVELLGQLKPDIYVKGKEYERNLDPRFLAERDAVLASGGRVVFSGGIVYSSTALINQMERTETFDDEKIARFRGRYSLTAACLQNLLHRMRGQRVVVIGDYILDRYCFCDATGIAGEGPMMALREMGARDFDGGAAVIALHAAGLGAEPVLVTSLAKDDLSQATSMRLRGAGIEVRAQNGRRSLVRKSRYLVDETKMFKVDEGSAEPLDSRAEAAVAQSILAASEGAAAVIFADFGYGQITAGLLDRIMKPLRKSVPVIAADVSGKQSNLLRFREVDLLCPTEREVRETLHDFASGLGAVVWNLLHENQARQAIITLGKQGLVTFDRAAGADAVPEGRLRSEYLPALTTHAVDPLGCGDALLATASLALAAGASLQGAAMLGSIAAGIEAQLLGNQPITTDRISAAITARDAATARIAS